MAAYRGGHYDVTKTARFRPGENPAAKTSRSISRRKGPSPARPLHGPRAGHAQPAPRPTAPTSMAWEPSPITRSPAGLPFWARPPMEVMVAHARDPVTPLSQIQPDVPPDLEAVVLRCLAKNPKDRYPDTPSLAESTRCLRRRRELVARARRRLVAGQPELESERDHRTAGLGPRRTTRRRSPCPPQSASRPKSPGSCSRRWISAQASDDQRHEPSIRARPATEPSRPAIATTQRNESDR